MCQYSALEGVAQTWHLVHLGGFAKGGAGLVMLEATAVSAEGRISPGDLGIWSNQQAEALRPIVDFIHSQNSVSSIQIAHAGRKASTGIPWEGGGPLPQGQGGWETLAPSAIRFSDGYEVPKEMTAADLDLVKQQFVEAAKRSDQIGIQVLEVHAAHGYLMHQFLSPLSNQRKDDYGSSLENRMRFPLEVLRAVRSVWPDSKPLFVRISATDWVEGGWDLEQSLLFSQKLKEIGVDLIDVSSGGLSPLQKIPVEPLYQVPFAAQIMKSVKIKVGAVGLITTSGDAERILQRGQADVIFMARELLRDPQWPLRAARELQVNVEWPRQYQRAKI